MTTSAKVILMLVTVLVSLACGHESDGPSPPAALRILLNPLDVETAPCGSATFEVVAQGQPPLAYQWFRGGVPILGANSPTLTIERAWSGSAADAFSVSVTSAGGTVLSEDAHLHVVETGDPIEFAEVRVFGEMAVEGADVYWTDGSSVNAAKSDCSDHFRRIYDRVEPGENTYALALTPSRVVWSDQALGAVRSAEKGGGAPLLIASGLGGGTPYLLIANGETIIWPSVVAGLQMVPSFGGTTTTLGDAAPVFAGDITSDRGFLYWTDLQSGTVKRMPLGGGAITILAEGQSYPNAILVDDRYVYWTTAINWDSDAPAGFLNRMTKDGTSQVVLATRPSAIMQLAADATHVYASASAQVPGSGHVFKVAIDGSESPNILASGLDLPFDVAVDTTFLYWADQRAIWRMPK